MRTSGIPDSHTPIPSLAHRFTNVVSALIWAAMVAFGAYVASTALGRAGETGTAARVVTLLAGVMTVAGGVALLLATYQDLRYGIRLNRNPRAMFGFTCLVFSAVVVAITSWW